MNDQLEFSTKVINFGILLYDKLDKEELVLIIAMLLVSVYIGYLLSSNLKPIITTDVKIQCPIYTELQSDINAYNVHKFLYATTKNGKITTLSCPFYTKGGKCNGKEKCSKI